MKKQTPTPRPQSVLRSAAALFAASCFSLNLSAQPVPPIPGNWQLTFEETFDGTTVDGNKWKMGKADAGLGGQAGNNPDNISVANGKLTLKATTVPMTYCGKACNYSGGELSTFMNFKQQYGYFEARMRWDQATGMWPAFWVMPERDVYGTKEWFVNSFLKFNLTGSGITTVTSAKLRLKVVVVGNDAASPNNLEAFRVADDSWTETGITWNNQPAWNPVALDQKWGFSAAAGSYIELDLTKFVKEEIAGDKVVSVALSDTYRRARRMAFNSREVTVAADRPQLVVNGTTTFYPTADAIVKWGTSADSHLGTTSELEVRTAYSGSTSSTYDGGMEFDIMETLGIWGTASTSHALHWDGYGADHKVTGWGPAPVSDTRVFHNYGVYWANGLIELYVDGIKSGSYNDPRAMSVPAYLILSLQLGGWDNNTPTAAVNNKTFEVEHVRAWSGTKSGSTPVVTTRKPDGTISFGSNYSVYNSGVNTASRMVVADDGSSFCICSNGWMKFPLNYTVTPNTWLEFTVNSSATGEILGIGLDEDDIRDNAKRIFQIAGSQVWTNGWQEPADYIAKSGPMTYQINVGAFYTGSMANIAIAADNDAGSIFARFSSVRITEGVPSSAINIGAINSGVAALEQRTGTGYLMYSQANVISRFGAYTGNADHIIAVYYSGGQWYADQNFGQVVFTPVSTDRLLAAVNFTADTVTSLQGVSTTENGIAKGYSSGNLGFIADWWAGAANDGEFGVTGTWFSP